ncbi:MAG: hypothetical protein DLM68_04505 [Hyphomicrobiales bacterium]|nr:MAG: hypothetical protein DLM68_04505 [Hyphomicrobiales bacterium]
MLLGLKSSKQAALDTIDFEKIDAPCPSDAKLIAASSRKREGVPGHFPGLPSPSLRYNLRL